MILDTWRQAFAKDSCDFSMLQHGSLVEKEWLRFAMWRIGSFASR